MNPDDLRQITDAVYYVAHVVVRVGAMLIAVIVLTAFTHWTTRK